MSKELLTRKLSLDKFLYLLSFDTSELKYLGEKEQEELRKEFMFIHDIFKSKYGQQFTKMFRSSVIGKCSAINGVIMKKQKEKLNPSIEDY